MILPTSPDVALFAHLACRREEDLDLGQAALLLAEPEYPGLDVAGYLQVLDQLAMLAKRKVSGIPEPAARAAALVRYLINEEHFRGNTERYDDPRNSFLNEVLDRHLGIPISLSVVMMEVGRHAGVPLFGVSFPGHFLLRGGPPEGGIYLDPFDGRLLDKKDLQKLLQRMTGEPREPTPAEMQVASKNAILSRMLNNLRNLYTAAGDIARLRLVTERLRLLEAAAKVPPPRRGPGGMLH